MSVYLGVSLVRSSRELDCFQTKPVRRALAYAEPLLLAQLPTYLLLNLKSAASRTRFRDVLFRDVSFLPRLALGFFCYLHNVEFLSGVHSSLRFLFFNPELTVVALLHGNGLCTCGCSGRS